MTQVCIYLAILISILSVNNKTYNGVTSIFLNTNKIISIELDLTAMEALDMVKEKYSANFEKVFYTNEDKEESIINEDGKEVYYYKLPFAEYYLVYEGYGETEKEYLIHLYEFVVDEADTGIGHTVTYGWYTVDRKTGNIKIHDPYE